MNIVVTGSSSGIGRAVTAHLLGLGHSVWGIARSEQCSPPDDAFGSFHPIRADVADWIQIERSASIVASSVSHVDGLVTCAGIQGEVGPALTSDPRNWSNTVRTNLEGTYYSIRAFAGLLRQSPRRAKIVCLSGGGATKARENFSAYGAAKTGVVRLVENIAAEAHHDPLDINAVAPGAINTRLTDEILSLGPEIVGANEYMAAVKQKESGGGSMEKAVALITFLLSAESDGISGKLLSAPWDKWTDLPARSKILASSDVYTLRRIVPEDRGIVM